MHGVTSQGVDAGAGAHLAGWPPLPRSRSPTWRCAACVGHPAAHEPRRPHAGLYV